MKTLNHLFKEYNDLLDNFEAAPTIDKLCEIHQLLIEKSDEMHDRRNEVDELITALKNEREYVINDRARMLDITHMLGKATLRIVKEMNE